ncbi:Hint domain-containing protein [Polaribacter cellanae]
MLMSNTEVGDKVTIETPAADTKDDSTITTAEVEPTDDSTVNTNSRSGTDVANDADLGLTILGISMAGAENLINATVNVGDDVILGSQVAQASKISTVLGVASIAINATQWQLAKKSGDELAMRRAEASGVANAAITYGGIIGWGVGLGVHFSLILNPNMTPLKPINNFSTTTCFVAGTMILMKDKKLKKIEDIVVGDEILSVDINTMNIEPDIVVAIPDKLKKYNMITAVFDNGISNTFSPAHPYWVKGKGWSVYDIEEAKKELSFNVKKIEVGDLVLYYSNDKLKETKILNLINQGKSTIMYNVEFVKKNRTFFANGILVHNKYKD